VCVCVCVCMNEAFSHLKHPCNACKNQTNVRHTDIDFLNEESVAITQDIDRKGQETDEKKDAATRARQQLGTASPERNIPTKLPNHPKKLAHDAGR
jgi:hypothetical protein